VDLKLISSTFALIFLAELGDKTQLATLALSASGRSRLSIFLGSALALAATSAIAVLVGEGLARVVPPIWLRRAAGSRSSCWAWRSCSAGTRRASAPALIEGKNAIPFLP
jgi:putative Ca2+/H+ antiporter (TMEM165/GDT1 family)